MLRLMLRKLWQRRQIRIFCVLLAVILAFFAALYISQTAIAHRDDYFTPDYPEVDLSELLRQSELSGDDYNTLFLQTGLGRSAVDALLAQGDSGQERLLTIQEQFFASPSVECQPLLGWLTREDHQVTEAGEITYGPELVDLQPGDLLLTLSTHTCGWRHGHAGIVVDSAGSGTSLECVVLGTDSTLVDASHWRAYANYAVLRVKGVTSEEQSEVVSYSLEHLLGVPYHLTAGFIGTKKAPETDYWAFGLQCSYLVWYAWNHMGYDLDSDGGRLVTTADMLHSDLLEVVQVFGFDPREFLN